MAVSASLGYGVAACAPDDCRLVAQRSEMVSMAGVTGVPGQVVRGKYPLIELMPGGM